MNSYEKLHEFSKELLLYRKQNALSQSELAELVGVTQYVIGKAERDFNSLSGGNKAMIEMFLSINSDMRLAKKWRNYEKLKVARACREGDERVFKGFLDTGESE